MPLRPNFLQQIRDKALDKLRKQISPTLPDSGHEDVPEQEQVPQGLGGRIKQEISKRVEKMSPVQRRMLDPNVPLDPETLKYRVRYAGQRKLLVLARYNNQQRHIEVYSWRFKGKKGTDGKKALVLFAFCRIHNRIHKFYPAKFNSFVVTDISYQPRWTIEF